MVISALKIYFYLSQIATPSELEPNNVGDDCLDGAIFQLHVFANSLTFLTM